MRPPGHASPEGQGSSLRQSPEHPEECQREDQRIQSGGSGILISGFEFVSTTSLIKRIDSYSPPREWK